MQRGFTYLLVVAAIAVLGIGLAAIGPSWADEATRDREKMLLRIGDLYAQAIASYVRAAPGSSRRYPPSLESLLMDDRYIGTRRHLRKLYLDPLDPRRPWGIVRAPDGGVMGVYSIDERRPYRRERWRSLFVELPPAETYQEWKFVPRIDS